MNQHSTSAATTHHNQRLGRHGEDVAAAYLQACGYQLITHNARCPEGEIDLILTHGDQLVFAEVKTRQGTDYGHPFTGLTEAKARRLYRLAHYWFHQQRQHHRLAQYRHYRVDAVAVTLHQAGLSLEHERGLVL